ncbi:alpha,alpha-trehalase TreF [Adhaeribacter radiodurans]|uniref:Alpha,alpha-trehalase TreF n=1 Tax=Adhaeribacter radiodurans TaxID=2745197 RepID=A0A7L7L957_9BACT|nr:alpha,alpha-trehalase TreF [Adhaeribacter radiodurans]QMU29366.1 alpha,alpha-trehalase TreF [Adhaeribacter radiodurans]
MLTSVYLSFVNFSGKRLFAQKVPVFVLIWFVLGSQLPIQAQVRPEVALGELFKDVQMQAVFPDSKTFPDCIPLSSPETILQAYQTEKNKADFNLKAFVLQHFKLPPEPATNFKSDTAQPVSQHINTLWPVLTRQPIPETSSLIPLPHSYVVPGGRFREIYYWDSYFTMLGLQAAGQTQLIQNMVDNFTFLIDTVGFIPNGNRSYYTGRSQPPFYALMVKILRDIKGQQVLKKYGPALQKEYEFWMKGTAELTETNPVNLRVVRLPDGSILNRYYDNFPEPRPEAYKEDVKLAQETGRNKEEVYRHLRAAAESGWDFTSRWFADGKTLKTIHTTDIIPVDLNALLYHLELTLAEVAILNHDTSKENYYNQQANKRKKALINYCWSKKDKYFLDYDFKTSQVTTVPSLAATYLLFFKMATNKQAKAVAKRLKTDFLKPGGLISTPNHTGEQWDAPNAWAPLQWISIQGLRNYRQHKLAKQVKHNWVEINTRVYKSTGKLVEKYNVEATHLEAGGGEYPLQDGFGWTNGVLLKLLSEK